MVCNLGDYPYKNVTMESFITVMLSVIGRLPVGSAVLVTGVSSGRLLGCYQCRSVRREALYEIHHTSVTLIHPYTHCVV